MDLNCIYSDLLENYLNFFLPINARDVNFPQLSTYSQQSQTLQESTTQQSSPYSYQLQAPRLLKASFLENNNQSYQSELIKQEESTLEQINFNLFQKKLDRTHDLQKIDFFLKLIIDLWICPFSDSSNEKYLNNN